MSETIHVQLPASIYRAVKALAEDEGVTVNQFIATAAAEKVASLKTVAYLEARAARGDRAAFEQVLAQVPDVEPEPRDRR
jgi:hypothetical protein